LQLPSPLRRVADFFGAHASPELLSHERSRAWQRIAACSAFVAVWAIDLATGQLAPARAALAAVILCYLIASVFYLHVLRHGAVRSLVPVYAFLVCDPFLLVLVLYLDPERFAFLNPLLFVVVVRSGLRYGVRTMYLSWGVTLLMAALLLTSPFWREEVELALAFFLMLALVPVFFTSLVRRLHGARAIEEERERLSSRSAEVLARAAFLARVSHELRSPLQGIVSALDVLALRHGPASGAEDEMIQRIRRSSLLLNTHLRDLLTLAKGEAGHLELRPEPFDACALAESVAASALDLARDKHLELIVEVPPGAVFVIADGARIDQILTNLVINSIRYTNEGQVRLTLREYSAARRMLEFVVADTGPGIPESMLPTLLAPDRTIASSERRGEGSGIGLAIVRTLVDHLGGTVQVESSAGRGTTFTVAIPAEPVGADPAAEAPESETGRVLVVDDDGDIADALGAVLDELGFECDRAPSVAVAANALASRRYDAALVDIEMPGRGGAELVEETRRAGGPNAATRFIGMSAGELAIDVRTLFDAALRKPIDHASLRNALLGPGAGARPSQPGLWRDAP
jgi:signal transduction histidine kinase/CheY-like chemotaxis protein